MNTTLYREIVNNIAIAKQFANFQNKFRSFYRIEIVKLREDDENMSVPRLPIRSVYVTCETDFDLYTPLIKDYCETLNARAIIYVNNRNIDSVAARMMIVAGSITNHSDKITRYRNLFDDAVGYEPHDDKAKWVLPMSSKKMADDAITYLNKLYKQVSTGGYIVAQAPACDHYSDLIVHPFPRSIFKEEFGDINIQTDGCITLYSEKWVDSDGTEELIPYF